MFNFPQRVTDEARLQDWVFATGNPSLLILPRNKLVQRTICAKHFHPKYVLLSKLCNTAIPTLYLPDAYSVHQEENGLEDLIDENQNYMEVNSIIEEESLIRMRHAVFCPICI